MNDSTVVTRFVCWLLCGWFAAGSVLAQDWTWLTNENRAIAALQHCSFIGDSGAVVGVGQLSLYVADRYGYATPLMQPADFVRIESRPRLYALPEGTVLIAGSTTDQRNYGVYRFEQTPNGLAYSRCNMDGEDFSVGFSDGDMSVLGNSIMCLRAAYTFDAGTQWYAMASPSSGGSVSSPRMIGRAGVFVHQAEAKQWLRVDTALRQFVPTSALDPDVCHIAALPGGGAMAIRCSSGEETDLVVRSSPSVPWEVVPPQTAENGAVVDPKRSVYLRGRWLFETGVGTAIFVLDSGRVVEYDGSNVRLRVLDTQPIPGRLASVVTERPRTPDVVRAVYEIGRGEQQTFTTVDISTQTGQTVVRRGLRYKPIDISETGYLSSGPYVTSWSTGITRPAIRRSNDASSLREQQYLPQVVACGKVPVTVAQSGEIFVLDSIERLPLLHSARAAARNQATSMRTLLGRVTMQVLDDTTFLYPSAAPARSYVSGKRDTLPALRQIPGSPRLTCATLDNAGRHVLAGSVIARLSGSAWDTIPYPERFRDSSVVISSIVFRGADTIVAAARGYGVGSSLSEGFRYRRGGIVISTDGGASWTTVELPLQEQWVENLTTAADGTLYCWATSMVFDAAYSQPADPMGRYGSARLYQSADGGRTWVERFADQADEEQRRQAVDHQWSISTASTGLMAISTPSAVYTALPGESFAEVLDLPLTGAVFGGCALGPDGTLWVSGSQGLHRRRPFVTHVRDDQGYHTRAPEISMRVAPLPASDVCMIRLHAHGFAQPDFVTLTSVDGSITLRVGRDGDAYPCATEHLPTGTYVAHAHVGSDVVTARVFVVR